jgi:hypothetical protein
MFTRRRQGISSSQFNRPILGDEVDDDDDDDDNDVDRYVTTCFYLASRLSIKNFHFSFRWGFLRYCKNFMGSTLSRSRVILSRDFSDYLSLSFAILHLIIELLKGSLKNYICKTWCRNYYCVRVVEGLVLSTWYVSEYKCN